VAAVLVIAKNKQTHRLQSSMYSRQIWSRVNDQVKNKKKQMTLSANKGLKPLSAKNVRDVGLALARIDGSTTTRDIKDECRSQGFWATQAQVAEFARDLVAQGILTALHQGNRYRTLIEPVPLAVVGDRSAVTPQWLISAPGTAFPSLSLPGSLSRTQARYQYTRIHPVQFAQTRSRRASGED